MLLTSRRVLPTKDNENVIKVSFFSNLICPQHIFIELRQSNVTCEYMKTATQRPKIFKYLMCHILLNQISLYLFTWYYIVSHPIRNILSHYITQKWSHHIRSHHKSTYDITLHLRWYHVMRHIRTTHCTNIITFTIWHFITSIHRIKLYHNSQHITSYGDYICLPI